MAQTYPSPEALIADLSTYLERTADDARPIAVMMCGVSGSGKSTTAQTLVRLHSAFTRISIDELIAQRHGIFGVDYPPEAYEEISERASEEFEEMAQKLIADGRDIVLDRAFYAREDRDRYRAIVKNGGGKVVLIYFDVPIDILIERVKQRRTKGVNANSARVIDDDTLKGWVAGFDVPKGEGEIVVKWIS